MIITRHEECTKVDSADELDVGFEWGKMLSDSKI